MSEDLAYQYAASIASLAQDPRFAPRSAELDSLGADLANPEGDTWAGVDLFAAFSPESVVRLRHRNILEGLLGALAAVSVFLPVAWTWHGFQNASSAYEELIDQDGEPEGRTFLGLWATGFDGRLSADDHLAPMALVSFTLIVLAVMFIVAHRLVAASNVRREERKLQEARIVLIRNLTGAAVVLNTRRADHPQKIEGIIRSSLDKLRKTQEAARKSTVALAETTEKVNAELQALLDTVSSARGESESLLAQATAVGASLEAVARQTGESLNESLSAMDGLVRTSVETTTAAVADSLQTTREALDVASRDLGERLSSSVDQLTESAVDAISSSGESLMGVVGQIGGSAQETSAAARALTDEVRALREDSTAASDDLSRRVADLRTTLELIEEVLNRHDSTLQGQASELTAARDAAERLLRHLTGALAPVGVPSSVGSSDLRS